MCEKVVMTVKLMGTPKVKLCGKEISFHLKSAEALFYYFLINETAAREKLAFF